MPNLSPAAQLLGEWKAQFEMPIKYVFETDEDLILHIQNYPAMPIKYTIDVTQTPMHLNIKHVGGPLGNGEEKCIFKFENNSNRLLIASPIPIADNSSTFGPRPTDFNGVTAVAFLRPGFEKEVRKAEMEKVKHLTDEQQISMFFTEASKVYGQYAEAIIKGDDTAEKFEQLQQLMMMQHLQVARQMRALEMRFSRPFEKIQQIIQKQNAADFSAEVKVAFQTFMEQMVRMQRIQQMFAKRAEENKKQDAGSSIISNAAEFIDADAAAAASAPPASDAKEKEPEKAVTLGEINALGTADKNGDGKLDEDELEGLVDKYKGIEKPKSKMLEATAPEEVKETMLKPVVTLEMGAEIAGLAKSEPETAELAKSEPETGRSGFTYLAIAGFCVAAGVAAYVIYNNKTATKKRN